MAGVHLPDIGKLGIRVATGIRDRKRVAPTNLVESARLRALSSRIETERQERYRILKKEERRMKRRKKRIDDRLDDIDKSRGTDLKLHKSNYDRRKRFPCLPSIRQCEPKKSLKEDCGSKLTVSSAIFPIQEEMAPSDINASEYKQIQDNKSVLRSLQTRKLSIDRVSFNNQANLQKRRKSSLEKKAADKNIELAEEQSTNSVPRVVLDNNSFGVSNTGSRPSIDISEVSDSSSEVYNGSRRRSSAFHQSLEDAMRAIRTCRYIRRPSRRSPLENAYDAFEKDFYCVDDALGL
ncbi:uncharacterized protein LOC116604073 [Nematostella vectensis]|uniref:uncharacterized protein LOC116604073 n=1 Tax=Nematostella vectensis TaxID=45351 RepID=UPI001390149B|nr:uncharacterized protein LOC116604073 [Nematostella vectensis]